MSWQDMGMYWAWRKPSHDKDGKVIPCPPPPTVKRLQYITFTDFIPTMRLCVGVWDDDKFTELHRDEMALIMKWART